MKKFIYQMFILGCDNLDNALANGLGGVIFFTKDIETEEDLKNKIKSIKSKSIIPPFISIDQEGGRVERTENIRVKRLSAGYALKKGRAFLESQSEEISKELAQWGFNLNFAPVADVNTNPHNPIIGERAFADNPEQVIEGMNIFIQASRKYGIIPCIKHYPGHGDADTDSHLTLPKIELPMEDMENVHILPFKAGIENEIEMIMAAHIHCTCFDKEPIPVSLSKNAILYLRKNLNYNGVIITDDMVMKGVQDFGSLEACIMAINAGVDMFIFRNSDYKTLKLIEDLCSVIETDKNLQTKVLKSYERISRLKSIYML